MNNITGLQEKVSTTSSGIEDILQVPEKIYFNGKVSSTASQFIGQRNESKLEILRYMHSIVSAQ